jgi:hypothetical protein
MTSTSSKELEGETNNFLESKENETELMINFWIQKGQF